MEEGAGTGDQGRNNRQRRHRAAGRKDRATPGDTMGRRAGTEGKLSRATGRTITPPGRIKRRHHRETKYITKHGQPGTAGQGKPREQMPGPSGQHVNLGIRTKRTHTASHAGTVRTHQDKDGAATDRCTGQAADATHHHRSPPHQTQAQAQTEQYGIGETEWHHRTEGTKTGRAKNTAVRDPHKGRKWECDEAV